LLVFSVVVVVVVPLDDSLVTEALPAGVSTVVVLDDGEPGLVVTVVELCSVVDAGALGTITVVPLSFDAVVDGGLTVVVLVVVAGRSQPARTAAAMSAAMMGRTFMKPPLQVEKRGCSAIKGCTSRPIAFSFGKWPRNGPFGLTS